MRPSLDVGEGEVLWRIDGGCPKVCNHVILFYVSRGHSRTSQDTTYTNMSIVSDFFIIIFLLFLCSRIDEKS